MRKEWFKGRGSAIGIVSFLVFSLFSCSDDSNGVQLGKQEGVVTADEAVTVPNLENPKEMEHCLKITHTVALPNGKTVVNYTTDYDIKEYVPRWVAFKFYQDVNNSGTQRQDDFRDDPQLPSKYHLGDHVYFSPYQRGHMCASADRLFSKEANSQTFYYTNMYPQIGDFNMNIWASLEAQVRQWRTRFDTLYVVRGGVLSADKYISVKGKKLNVPSKYWMALLGRTVKRSGDTFTAIAFCLDHKEYGGDQQFSTHRTEISRAATTISRLENLTGIDFFPALPDGVEKQVESSYSRRQWTGIQ